jgi:hypothetical protein
LIVSGAILNSLTGFVCLECAAYINKISKASVIPIIRYTTLDLKDSDYLSFIKVDSLNHEDTFKVHEDMCVTNAERTICDLINYDRAEEFIYSAIEDYIGSHEDVVRLLEYAVKYNCVDKMRYFIGSLDEAIREGII